MNIPIDDDTDRALKKTGSGVLAGLRPEEIAAWAIYRTFHANPYGRQTIRDDVIDVLMEMLPDA